MDYEKAYKDALQLARSYYDKGTNEFLDTIFPELAEGEDEKTAREIKEFILYKAGHLLDEATEHRFIAYLEKQKDANKEYWRGYQEDKQGILDKYAEIKKQKEQNGTNGNEKENSNEHESAGWTTEDKEMIRRAIFYTEHYRSTYSDTKESEECFDWLLNLHKSLKPQPHWKPSNEQMKSLLNAEGHLRRYECREIAKDIAKLYNDLKKL